MYIKSARFQLENWDAQAWLGSQPSQLGLAQLGKLQLELITNTWVFHSDQGQILIESHKSRNNLDDAVTFSVKLPYSRKVFLVKNKEPLTIFCL